MNVSSGISMYKNIPLQSVMMKSKYRDVLEIVAALAAAYIAYNLLILVAGTPMPIVSVVSESMYHQSSFDEWWQQSRGYYEAYSIGRDDMLSYKNPNGLAIGDLLFVTAPDNINVGDIVIYQKGSITVVHRVVQISGSGSEATYMTKGDNPNTNSAPDSGLRAKSELLGKVRFSLPLLGYPRLMLFWLGI